MKNLKKVLILFGSPHSSGFSSKLLTLFLAELERLKMFKTHKINAYEEKIKPCIDCGYCKTTEACIFKDLDKFDILLRKCDLIIIASPIYGSSFPAPLKAILDRMQRYFNAKFSLKIDPTIEKRKNMVLILTQGSNDKDAENCILHQLKGFMSVANTQLVGTIFCPGTDNLNFDVDNFWRKSQNEISKVLEFIKKTGDDDG